YEYQRAGAQVFDFPLSASTIQGPSAAQVAYINALKTSGNPFLVGFANGITPGMTPLNNPALNKIVNRDNGSFDDTLRRANVIGRLDIPVDANNAVNVRIGYGRNIARTNMPDGNMLFASDWNILSSWTHTFSPTVVNQ